MSSVAVGGPGRARRASAPSGPQWTAVAGGQTGGSPATASTGPSEGYCRRKAFPGGCCPSNVADGAGCGWLSN